MSETTKRILIAAVAAAVLIAGSVAAIAVVDDGGDDDDDEKGRPLFALIDELDEEFEAGEVLEQLFERFLEEQRSGDLSGRVLDMLDTLRGDLVPPSPPPEVAPLPEPEDPPRRDDRPRDDRPRDDRRRHEPGEPFEGFGFRFGPGGEIPFLEDSPLDEFLEDGHLTLEEREELQAWFRHRFGEVFGFEIPGDGFAFPPEGLVPPEDPVEPPFDDLPLDEFLEDGRISPDEARELERLFRERFHGVFRFEFVPPETDRPQSQLPDALLEGLRDLPFREFLADGELSPEEREILREALNAWLDRVFERFGNG